MVRCVRRFGLLVGLLALLGPARALARDYYFAAFVTRYPSSPLIASMNCTICHPNNDHKKFTLYGAAYKATSGTYDSRFQQIEAMDTDGDGAPNLVEIDAGTDPSDNTSTPPRPQVTGVARQNPAGQLTAAASVVWRVTFSEAVSGVGPADFSLTKPSGGTLAGTSIASVAAVAGSGNASYDVTVNTGTGSGELRLDVAAGATILNTLGMNVGNAPYTAGATYLIRPNAAKGWILYE